MDMATAAHPNASLFASGGPLSAEAIAELRAHPRFPHAVRAIGSGMIAIYRGNRLLNMLINDRGRMTIGYLALYLHGEGMPDGSGNGFGISQLKALCADAGVASPGRASAMIALMRMTGYLASASTPDDRRRHLLVPTERLRSAHRDRWNAVVAALREVRPDAAAAFALGDPAFEAAYVRHTADPWIAGMRMLDVAPEMRLFVDRNAGLMILFSIFLASAPDDTIPPTRPVPISISALAQRFGVSRVHVRTLLRDAEAAGLIERTGEGGGHVAIRPKLADAANTFFALVFLFLADGGMKASEDIRRARQEAAIGQSGTVRSSAA